MAEHDPFEQAEDTIRFIEKYCKVPIGPMAGQPFELLPWQKETLREALETREVKDPKTGKIEIRRIRSRVFTSMARKNGKSCFFAAVIVAFLAGPLGWMGIRILILANSRDQAGELFDMVKKIMMASETLSKTYEFHKQVIFSMSMGTQFKIVAANEKTAHGLGCDVSVVDEIAQMRDLNLFNTLEESMAGRPNHIMFCLSTLTEHEDNALSELMNMKKAGEGIGENYDHWLVKHWHGDKEMDVFDDRQIPLANPSAPHWPELMDSIIKKRAKAKVSDAEKGRFRTFSLNLPGSSVNSLIDIDKWLACAHPDGVDHHKTLEGAEVTLGLDLSRNRDITSLGLYAIEESHVHSFNFLPRAEIQEYSITTGKPFDVWAERGYLEPIHGEVIDYDYIAGLIKERIAGRYRITKIRYDRHKINEFKASMDRVGLGHIPVEDTGMGYWSMEKMITRLENLVHHGKITHSNSPIMNYAMFAAITKPAANSIHGDRTLHKSHYNVKIDPAVAVLFAVGPAAEESPTITDIGQVVNASWRPKKIREAEAAKKKEEERKKAEAAAREQAQQAATEAASAAREAAANNVIS